MEKSAAAAWAVEELCNQGCVQSLEVIRRSILKRNPTAAGGKNFNFCEARIHALGRNPDRISSLASALTIANVSAQRGLVGWAINELSALNSPRADGELASFMNELGQEITRTSAGSDLDRDLRSKHFQIGRLLSQRHK